MSRLDDPGMDGTDRDAMQIFTFDRKKRVSLARYPPPRRTKWKLHIPKAEIQPGARIRSADGLQSVETVNGPLQTNGRPMQRPDRRECLLRAFEAHDRYFLCHHRH